MPHAPPPPPPFSLIQISRTASLTATSISAADKMSKTLSPSEVSAHNTPETGLYIIVDSSVYDLTGFIDEHPGGSKILKRVGGKDASKQFWKVWFL